MASLRCFRTGTKSRSALLVLTLGFAAVPAFCQMNAPAVQALGTLSELSASSSNNSLLSSQANPAISASPLTAVPEDFSKLKIAPGFLISLQTFDEPALSGVFRVEDDGNISLPLAGVVHVAGFSNIEAQHAIEDRFTSLGILKHPQVIVAIQQYAPFIVAVVGEIARPGRLEFIAPHSLLDVITQAGGETPLAGNMVRLKHVVNGVERTDSYPYHKGSDADTIKSVMVGAGDTVIVPRAGIVYVLGAVTRPGGYLMQEDGDLNVAQALSLALGTTLQGKVSDTRIVRRKLDGTVETIPVDYTKVMAGSEVPPPLRPEDILYVPVSKVKTVFTTGASVLGAAATSTVYAIVR